MEEEKKERKIHDADEATPQVMMMIIMTKTTNDDRDHNNAEKADDEKRIMIDDDVVIGPRVEITDKSDVAQTIKMMVLTIKVCINPIPIFSPIVKLGANQQ